MSFMVLLQQYSYQSVLGGKGESEEVFSKIRACKYRHVKYGPLYVFKGFLSFRNSVDFFILSQHISYTLHYFDKGNNKSSQKIYPSQKGLNLHLSSRELDFADRLHPLWIYPDAFLRYYIP